MPHRIFVDVLVNGSKLQDDDEVILNAYGPRGGTQACVGMTRANAAALAARINDALQIDHAPAMLAALELAAELIDEAMTFHIYDADQGEAPGPECGYANGLATIRAAIAAAKGA